MKEKNMPKADFATSIFLILFGVFILYQSLQMPRFEERHINPYSVPGLVPGFLGVVIAFLGLVLFIRSLLRGGYRLGITGSRIKEFFLDESTRRILTTIILSVGYGVFLGKIQFSVLTALYVFLFIVIFDYKREKALKEQWKIFLSGLIVAVLTSASVTYVFQYLFLVNLP